jgi:hypothetical protein
MSSLHEALFVVNRCFSEFAVTASFLMSPILEKLIGKDFLMQTSQREKNSCLRGPIPEKDISYFNYSIFPDYMCCILEAVICELMRF